MESHEALDNVLVTGGNHFVGYHLVSALVSTSLNIQISVLDAPSSLLRFPQVTYYDVDITSKPAVRAAIAAIKPKVVFHAACTYSLSLPALTHHRVNYEGTTNVLEAVQATGTARCLIYHSSSSVIEDGVSDVLRAGETRPVLMEEQKYPYPRSKARAEALVLAANRRGGLLTTSIRPAGTFGEADEETIGKLIGVARDGKARMQMGDGQNVFDFLYVGNLVHAHLLAARTLIRASKEEVVDGERVDGQAFHITNDEPWLFWEFIRAIAAEAGYPVMEEEVRAIPRWLGMLLAFFGEWWVWIVSFGRRESGLTRYGVRYSTLNRTLDIEKAKRVLGYRPIFTMREGIERSVRWVREREKQV